MSRKSMRILVLGDENVGKSSLIHTIYSEVSSNVQKTLKKVILPPQMCLYSKEVFTQLVDTSVDMDVTADIRTSDLVLLVYDVSDPQTIARIDTDWLPKINLINSKIPIILVGNKMDKKQLEFQDENQYIKVKDILRKVTKRFKNVQMGIQCSAFYDRNVKSVLNCAQRAVLYPLSPLYSLQQKKITQNFRKALIRIFRILDQDFDGRLYDSQLNALQERVFQSQLNSQDIKAIKQIILKELQVQQQDYIEIKGFIALQKKVIQMLKIQICWSILRHFNYDDDLKIKVNTENFIVDQNASQSVQLSSQAINFLIKTYHTCKKNCQSMVEQEADQQKLLQKIFEPFPSITFEQFIDLKQDMSEQKFLTTWSLYAFLNYKNCYQDLLYLGFQQSLDEAFSRRKTKKLFNDFQKIKQNKVFSIMIVQNTNYQSYITPLFADATKIKILDQQQRQILSYSRSSHLFSNQAASKTFLLFKVKKQDLPFLFDNKNLQSQTTFAKKIDLLIQFDQQSYEDKKIDTRNLIPNYMLYRKINKNESQQILYTNNPPKLDLSSFPIKYDQLAYTPLFNQIIFKTFQNIEEGLTKQKIDQLKKQSKQKKNMLIVSIFSVALTGIVVGNIFLQIYKKVWKS